MLPSRPCRTAAQFELTPSDQEPESYDRTLEQAHFIVVARDFVTRLLL